MNLVENDAEEDIMIKRRQRWREKLRDEIRNGIIPFVGDVSYDEDDRDDVVGGCVSCSLSPTSDSVNTSSDDRTNNQKTVVEQITKLESSMNTYSARRDSAAGKIAAWRTERRYSNHSEIGRAHV